MVRVRLVLFSGLTPRAVDTLNNTGKAAYTLAPTDNCPLHAGYERDLAVGTTTGETTCTDVQTTVLSAPLIKELDKFRSDWAQRKDGEGIVHPPNYRALISNLTKGIKGSGSYYADNGYKHCGTPIRNGYQFGPAP